METQSQTQPRLTGLGGGLSSQYQGLGRNSLHNTGDGQGTWVDNTARDWVGAWGNNTRRLGGDLGT